MYIRPYIHHLQENLNILRDSAHLQTQLRVFDALVETRHTLLRLRPNLRQNWVALAVAYHLNGEFDEARKVLERYESILKVLYIFLAGHTIKFDLLGCTRLRYRTFGNAAVPCGPSGGGWSVLRSAQPIGRKCQGKSNHRQNGRDGTERYHSTQNKLRDTDWCDSTARLLTKLGNVEEAEHAWRVLIQQNSDCRDYYKGYLSTKGLDLGLWYWILSGSFPHKYLRFGL